MKRNGFRPQELNLSEIINRLESSPDFSFTVNDQGLKQIRRDVDSFHVGFGKYIYHEVHIASELPAGEVIVALKKLLGKTTSYDGSWKKDYALCYDHLNTSKTNNGKERTYVVLELHKRNGT